MAVNFGNYKGFFNDNPDEDELIKTPEIPSFLSDLNKDHDRKPFIVVDADGKSIEDKFPVLPIGLHDDDVFPSEQAPEREPEPIVVGHTSTGEPIYRVDKRHKKSMRFWKNQQVLESISGFYDNYRRAIETNPNEFSKRLNVANRVGLPVQFLDDQEVYNEAKKAAGFISQRPVIDSFSPELRAWASRPTHMELVWDDLENLKKTEDILKYQADTWNITQGSRAGEAQKRLGDIYFRMIFGKVSDADLAAIPELKKVLEYNTPVGAGILDTILSGAGRQYGQRTGQIERGAKYGAYAGTAATLAIVAASALGAVPTGGASVVGGSALLGSGLTAGGVVAAAFGAGFSTGVIHEGFIMETGLSFMEFSELEDENGQLIDPDIAKVGAIVYGIVASGIESAQMDKLLAFIPNARELFTKTGIKSLLKNKTVRSAIGSALKDYAGDLTFETITEVGQQAAEIMARHAVKMASKHIDGTNFKYDSAGDVISELWETGKSSFLEFMLPMTLGPSLNYYIDSRAARAARHNMQVFEALNDTAKASKLRERSPETYGKLIDELTKDGPVHEIGVNGQAFATYFQSIEMDPLQIAEELGVADQYTESLATDGEIQIPVAMFAEKLAGTEHFEGLMNDLRIGDNAMTVKEANAHRERLKEEYYQILNEQAENEAEQAEFDSVKEQFRAQFVALGHKVIKSNEAELYSVLFTHGLAVEAKNRGMGLREFVDKFVPSFRYDPQGKLVVDGAKSNELNQLLLDAYGQEVFSTEAKLAQEEAAFATVVDFVDKNKGNIVSGQSERMMTTPLAVLLAEQSRNAQHAGQPNKQTTKADIRDIITTHDVIEKMMVNHNLTTEQVKQLPRSMVNPIMILDSSPYSTAANKQKKAIVVMVEMKDSVGATVIVPIHLEETTSGKKGVYNIAASAYGRTQPNTNRKKPDNSWFISEANAGRTLYIDRRKISAWSHSSHLSLASEATLRKHNPSLMTEFDLVNARNAYPGNFQDTNKSSIDNYSQRTNGVQHIQGSYDAIKNIITIFKAGDKSTLLHEMAHFFLSSRLQLALMGGMSEQTSKDWASILNWLEVDDIDFTKELSKEDAARWKTAHEKFARGFEKYLTEGVAPSTELQKAFRAFRNWLTSIYKEIKNILYTDADGQKHEFEINDEIRGVMDRMLATEEEIEAARVLKNARGFVDFLKARGIPDVIVDKYKDIIEKSSDKAKAKLYKKLTAYMREEKKAELAELKREARKQASKEVWDLPEYKAYSALRRPLDNGGLRLSIAALKEWVDSLDSEIVADVESTDGAQDMSPLNDLSKVDNTESMAHDKQLAVDIEEFGNSVDAYVNNPKGWNKSKPVPVLSKTPPVFKLLGAEEHPITMNAKHFGNVIDTKEKEALPKKKRDKLHPLPADIIKQIPQALMRPVLVLKDSSTRKTEKKYTTFIVMLEVRHEGKSIVVPLTLNIESVGKQYNIIDSIYGKDGRDIRELGKGVPYEEYFIKEAEKNLLYIDKEKAREWARIADEENKKNRSEALSASLTKITKIESLLAKLEALLQNDSFMESISTEADLDKLYQEEKAREWARVADEDNKKNRSETQSTSITKITKIESLTAILEALLQNDSFMESISTEADLDKLHQEDKKNLLSAHRSRPSETDSQGGGSLHNLGDKKIPLQDESVNSARIAKVKQIQEMKPVQVTPTEPVDKAKAKIDVGEFGHLTNKADGRKAFFPMETIGKMFDNLWYKTSTMMSDMKSLFETSILAWTEPEIQKEGHKTHRNVLAYHHYVNKFTDNTGTYYIRFAVREVIPAKKGKSRSLADSHIHYMAISEVSEYKENDGSPRRIPEHPGRDGQKSPFIDIKLQQFFDSVKKAPDLEGKKPDAETSSQSRPERGGSGLNSAAYKALMNELPTGVASRSGLDLDIAAELLGYPSVEALISDLKKAKLNPPQKEINNRVRAATDSLVQLINDPEALRLEVENALHNEERAQWLALEMEILSKEAERAEDYIENEERKEETARDRREESGQRAQIQREAKQDAESFARNIAAKAEAFARAAKEAFLGKSLKDLQHIAKYRHAENRAADNAYRVAVKGDVAAAHRYKNSELLNGAMYTEGLSVRDYVEKQYKYLNKFKLDNKYLKGVFGENYFNQIMGILYGIRYVFPSVKDEQIYQKNVKRGRLSEFVDKLRKDKEIDLPIAQWILDLDISGRIPQSSFKGLSISEFMDVVDAVRALDHIARQENMLLTADRNKDFNAVVSDLESTTVEKHGTPKPMSTDPNQKSSGLFKKVVATHDRVETLLRMVDNFEEQGLWWDTFYKPSQRAYEAEIIRGKSVKNAIDSIFRKHFPNRSEFAHFMNRKFDTGLIDPANGKQIYWTGEQLLAAMMNWGTQRNRERLVFGQALHGLGLEAAFTSDEQYWQAFHVGAAAAEGVFSRLASDDHWAFVQSVWDLLEGFWPDISELERNMKGFAPQKEEALPVRTAGGKVLSGGYYPVRFDSSKNWKSFVTDEKENTRALYESIGIDAHTKRGHTKERADFVVGRPLLLSLSVIDEHAANVIHDLTHRPLVRNLTKLIKDNRVAAMLNHAIGMDGTAQIQPWISGLAASTKMTDATDIFITKLLGKSAAVQLGINVVSMIGQTVSLVPAAFKLGPVATVKALTNAFLLRPFWDSGYRNAAFALSPELADRLNGTDRNIRAALDLARSTRGRKFLDEVNAALYVGMGWADMWVSLSVWTAAYDKGLNQFNGDSQKAVDYADYIVRTTNNTGAAKDLAQIQRGSPFKKLFTMYYSAFGSLYQLFHEEMVKAGKGGIPDKLRLAAFCFMVFTVQAALEDLLKGRDPWSGDDELDSEEIAKWLLQGTAGTFASMFPGVRDVVSGAIGGFGGYKASPALDAGATVARAMSAVTKNTWDIFWGRAEDVEAGKTAKKVFDAGGYIFGLPTIQLSRWGRTFMRWVNDEPDFSPWEAIWAKRNK